MIKSSSDNIPGGEAEVSGQNVGTQLETGNVGGKTLGTSESLLEPSHQIKAQSECLIQFKNLFLSYFIVWREGLRGPSRPAVHIKSEWAEARVSVGPESRDGVKVDATRHPLLFLLPR